VRGLPTTARGGRCGIEPTDTTSAGWTPTRSQLNSNTRYEILQSVKSVLRHGHSEHECSATRDDEHEWGCLGCVLERAHKALFPQGIAGVKPVPDALRALADTRFVSLGKFLADPESRLPFADWVKSVYMTAIADMLSLVETDPVVAKEIAEHFAEIIKRDGPSIATKPVDDAK
jgi:hypothetical protein